MRVTLNLPNDPEVIEAALTGLVAVNVVLIEKYGLPSLFETGARYVRERGSEIWQPASEVVRKRRADCEDLAAYAAADDILSGIPSRVRTLRGGRRMLHAVVERPDGSILDPSAMLGMRKP